LGNSYKPQDYLEQFAEFVRDNPSHIRAIEILLKRPQDWSPQALTELREKLARTQQRFTVENLQTAHQLHYHKALVDIISMIQHAANDESPLLTAVERVENVFSRLFENPTFLPLQRQWLGRIRQHLIENLSISREDFDEMPVFAREGGWKVANKAFDGRLDEFIQAINKAIAA
jgi:type I restriction enzyme R subunit